MAQGTKSTRRASTTRKTRRTMSHGQAHVHATFNNTIVTITDTQGNAVVQGRAGAGGFKGSRKSTPYAAGIAADAAAKRAMEHGLRQVEVFVKGPGSGRPDGANLALLDSVQACESISLHVRRGDYVSNPETNAGHGVCDVSYYQRAVGHAGERVSSAHLFVFSDDPVWARENLTFSFPTTFVDCNGPDQPQEDLRLMAACRHNILANSSLSWWGAWLNANSGKTVIAPRQWFRHPKVDTGDLIPAGWIRL